MTDKRGYGDYQTPSEFTDRVCHYLKDVRHIAPSAVIEPTCGIGNFLKSSLIFNAEEYYGIEINPDYCNACKKSITDKRVKVINSDFFSFSSKSLIANSGQVLVIGNPPWVTNSTLSSINSDNSPAKANFKGLRGIDAITGASNFDISEYIILQLINEYRDTNTVIAILCKTSVARNVFKELKRTYVNFSSCDILEFDASEVFGVSTGACLLVLQLSEVAASLNTCNVYDFDEPQTIKSQIGYSDGRFYSSLAPESSRFDGHCCFEWRQGVKHDCSKIMELTVRDGTLYNGSENIVHIEPDIVYPLIKSSMFKSPIVHDFSKRVIVTQKSPRERTDHLKKDVPMTWEYLNENISLFESRKSSIYKDAPPFSMFGVGSYSYSRYKVGVSGFYKQPMFSVLYSDDGKPVMTDDTSYFISFDSFDMAYVAMLLLNSQEVQGFLMSISFSDAKRPYTKKVLNRIDFGKIVEAITIDTLYNVEHDLHLRPYISSSMYKDFKDFLEGGQMRFA
ncbi:MAG: hypothetical protein LUF29_08900 [Oscillospiraceae bacterium]|nr:hypothetical protein [Oscillospiraceae bacterium]